MSQLEDAAMPVIRSLIDHTPILVDNTSADDLSTLAKWSFKTAIVINAAANYRSIVPEEHFRSFCSSREIPLNTWVDMSVLPTGKSLDWDQSQFMTGCVLAGDEARFRQSQAKSYNIVLGIGKMLIRVFHNPIPELELKLLLPDADLLRIHPMPPYGDRCLELGPGSLAAFAHAATLQDARAV